MYYKDSANFIMVHLFPDGSIPLPLCNHHGDLLFARVQAVDSCPLWVVGLDPRPERMLMVTEHNNMTCQSLNYRGDNCCQVIL